MSLRHSDPEIADAIEKEKTRQQETLDLIASENYPSKAVMEAQGSLLTSKYAEGYPGNRYYAGCVNVDEIEKLAIKRAKELYGAEHSNVQPHSGSQANMSVYLAVLNQGDSVLAMSRSHGGHLTHGDKASFSGQYYRFTFYGVNRETERIDYPEVERLAKHHQPKLIVAGASSYPRIIDYEWFRRIADMTGALLMVDMAHAAGMVAAGVHPSPVPFSDFVTATTHKTLRGPRGAFVLCKKGLAKALDAAVFPGVQGGPFMNTIAAKAVAFHEAMQPSFAEYQKRVLDNAVTLSDELKSVGLRPVSGGTDNHFVLVDISSTGVTGREAEEALEKAGIVTNRNAIPFDERPPRSTSGVRLGTPAVTTRGLGKEEMKLAAAMIVRVIKNHKDSRMLKQVREDVLDLCKRFPIPGFEE